ncbi:hypothetical protein WG68_14945 [Arsukibacterium ikkense]|uniref:Uncharacterized protein n=1 Tax=Arsukibacterium ikkense TaxID=336831 RepID=A0A0M2V4M0_9GAMM|nr:hypothetical protein WG68_14945 [Arsukibacterium ikkense]
MVPKVHSYCTAFVLIIYYGTGRRLLTLRHYTASTVKPLLNSQLALNEITNKATTTLLVNITVLTQM